MLVVGWSEIAYRLGGRHCGSDFPSAEMIEQWKREGIPVWYVPELDDRPRIESREILKWFKLKDMAARKSRPKVEE